LGNLSRVRRKAFEAFRKNVEAANKGTFVAESELQDAYTALKNQLDAILKNKLINEEGEEHGIDTWIAKADGSKLNSLAKKTKRNVSGGPTDRRLAQMGDDLNR